MGATLSPTAECDVQHSRDVAPSDVFRTLEAEPSRASHCSAGKEAGAIARVDVRYSIQHDRVATAPRASSPDLVNSQGECSAWRAQAKPSTPLGEVVGPQSLATDSA